MNHNLFLIVGIKYCCVLLLDNSVGTRTFLTGDSYYPKQHGFFTDTLYTETDSTTYRPNIMK